MIGRTAFAGEASAGDFDKGRSGGQPEHSALRLGVKLLEDRLHQVQGGTVAAMAALMNLKRTKTGPPPAELVEWTLVVAESLGIRGEELRAVKIASALHDLGKIGIPDAILEHRGELGAEEREVVRKHPELGWCILRSIPGFERASLLVLHHQENFDGSGYPSGLEREQIPLGARIVAVVDAFEAVISGRDFRQNPSAAEVFRRLRAGSGEQFDPLVVERFIEVVGERLWPSD